MAFLRSSIRRFSQMRVHIVPQLSDNYAYILENEKTKQGLLVDVSELHKVLPVAEKLNINTHGALITHHHRDHSAGSVDLQKYATANNKEDFQIIYSDDRIDGDKEQYFKLVSGGEQLDLIGLKIQCLSTPCHTRCHVCYFCSSTDSNEQPLVFTGDTLFIAGCGRFFEGTAEEMNENLNVKLADLPDNTLVYPGHEYTFANLQFARAVEPNNKKIAAKYEWADKQRQTNSPTVPSTISEEKLINPFMRVGDKDVQSYAGASDVLEVMQTLRERKNNFKAL